MSTSQFPYFIWKGVRCTEKGIIVEAYPPIVKPKERVEQITIPGRAGKLIIPEGDYPVYDNYLKSVKCWCTPGEDIDQIVDYLKGAGLVIFGNEPDRAYAARIINQIDFAQIMSGRQYRNFTIPFDVSPLKRVYPESDETIYTFTSESSDKVVCNLGNMVCYPTVTITVDSAETIILTIANNYIRFAAPAEGTYILDFESQMYYRQSTLENVSLYLTGDRVMLYTDAEVLHGRHTVSWTGEAVSITIRPNWRWV